MEARNGFEREGRCIKEEGDMGYAWLPVCHKQRPIFCFRLAVAGGVRGAKHTLSFSICVYACVRALIILLLNFYVLLRCFYMSFWYLFSLVHRVFSHLENQVWSIIQKAFYFVRKNESKKHFCIHWSPEFCLSKQIIYAPDHCLFFACASGLRELTCILLAN